MTTTELQNYIQILLLLNSIALVTNQNVIRVSRRASQLPSASASATEASPAISAILLECPGKDHQIDQQLMVNVRVSPSFRVEKLEKYLILDEVYDHRRQARAKIMSPYLIEISRGEPVVMYPLEFTKDLKCDTCGDPNCKKNTRSFGANAQPMEVISVSDDDERETMEAEDAAMANLNENLSAEDDDDENLEILDDDIRHQRMYDEPNSADAVVQSDDDDVGLASHRIDSNEVINRHHPNIDDSRSLCGDDDLDDESSEDNDDDDYDDDYVDDNQGKNCRPLAVDENNNEDLQRFTVKDKVYISPKQKFKTPQRSRVHNRLENYRKFQKQKDEHLRDLNDQLMRDLTDRSDKVRDGIVNGYREQALQTKHIDDNKLKREMDLYSSSSSSDGSQDAMIDDLEEIFNGNPNSEYQNGAIPFASSSGIGLNKKMYYPVQGRRPAFSYPKPSHSSYPLNFADDFNEDNENADDESGIEVSNNGKSPIVKKKDCKSNVCGESPKPPICPPKCPHKHPPPPPKDKCKPDCPSEVHLCSSDAIDTGYQLGRQRSPKRHRKGEANKNGRTGDSVLHLHDSTLNFETNPSNLKSGKHFSHDNFDFESMCDRIGCSINDNGPRPATDAAAAGGGVNIAGIGSSNAEIPDYNKMHHLPSIMESIGEQEEQNFNKYPQNFHSEYSISPKGITDLKLFPLPNRDDSNDFQFSNEDEFGDDIVGDNNRKQYDFGTKKLNYFSRGASLVEDAGDDFVDRRTRELLNSEYDISYLPEDSAVAGPSISAKPCDDTRFEMKLKLGQNGQTISKNVKCEDESNRVARKVDKNKTPKVVSRKGGSSASSSSKLKSSGGSGKVNFGGENFVQNDYENNNNNFNPNSALKSSKPRSRTRTADKMSDKISATNAVNAITSDSYPFAPRSENTKGYAIYPGFIGPLMPSIDSLYNSPKEFEGKKSQQSKDQTHIVADADKVPLENILDDPNLNIDDKMSVLQVIDPTNVAQDLTLEKMLNDMHNSDLVGRYVSQSMPATSMLPTSTLERKRNINFNQMLKRKSLKKITPNKDSSESSDDELAEKNPNGEELVGCKECGGKKTYGKPKTGINIFSKYQDKRIVERKPDESASFCSECGGWSGSGDVGCNGRCNCRSERKCKCKTHPMINDKKQIRRSVAETWYSVFNMSAPLQFLTTNVRIFQKRSNIWSMIAPSITLTSLSGIYANENLSIMFSSHVDIFQLKKPLRLVNHKLLIPKDDERRKKAATTSTTMSEPKSTTNEFEKLLTMIPDRPDRVLAVDATKFNFNSMPSSSDEHLKKIDSNEKEGEKHDVQAAAETATAAVTPTTSSVASEKANAPPAIVTVSKAPQSTVTTTATSSVATNHRANDDEKISFCRALQESTIIRNDLQIVNTNDDNDRQRRSEKVSKNPLHDIHSIIDFGSFPDTMGFLERCPHSKDHLCLNMLGEQVPSYTLKLKMPFKKNALIFENEFQARISNVISDATSKEALQIVVDVINIGYTKQLFTVSICNCPMACIPARTTVDKYLLPHIGESVCFLLPLVMESNGRKNRKFHCDVEVKAITSPPPKGGGKDAKDVEILVSKRRVKVESRSRCLCVWECNCHCVPKQVSHVEINVCRKMSTDEEEEAGLLPHAVKGTPEWEEYFNDEDSAIWLIYSYTLWLLYIMLLLGLIKATIGLCVEKVNRFGYNYVQLHKKYEYSSKRRRFFVNVVIFIIWPFVFWCKCFTPSEEDLRAASTEWQCSLIQERISKSSSDDYNNSMLEVDDDEEETILSQHYDEQEMDMESNNNQRRRFAAGFDIGDFETELSNMNSKISNNKMLIFDDFIYENDDSDEDTKFVLQALVESRESLRKLLKRTHSSEQVDENNPKAKKADQLVQSLKSAKIVYRIFETAVGNVRNIAAGRKYSVQGYFLPSIGPEYEFVNYDPIQQHHSIAANGKAYEIRPPNNLNPKDLGRIYANKLEVLEAADLSVKPPIDAPCINVLALLSQSSIDFVEQHRQQWRQDRELNVLFTRDPDLLQGQLSSEVQLPEIIEANTVEDVIISNDNPCGEQVTNDILSITDDHLPAVERESNEENLKSDFLGNFDI